MDRLRRPSNAEGLDRSSKSSPGCAATSPYREALTLSSAEKHIGEGKSGTNVGADQLRPAEVL